MFDRKLLTSFVPASLTATVLALFVFAVEAPAQAVRTITVVTEPKASVWLDGVLYGRADANGKFELTSVAAGAHSLKVRSPGYKDLVKPLAATAKGEIKAPLTKTEDPAELAFQEGEKLSTQDRAKSVEAFTKAVTLRPNFPQAYIAMARVQTEDQEYEDALASITKARKLAPTNAEASAVEGRILKESGENEKAVAAFKRSIAEGKGFQPEAYTGLAMLFKERAEGCTDEATDCEATNFAESEKYFKTAVKQLGSAPDNVVVMQLLGLIYERRQQKAEAIALYEQFLKLFPNSAEASAVRSFIVQLKEQ